MGLGTAHLQRELARGDGGWPKGDQLKPQRSHLRSISLVQLERIAGYVAGQRRDRTVHVHQPSRHNQPQQRPVPGRRHLVRRSGLGPGYSCSTLTLI